ncbi:MAG: PAS domain S-box protein [Desulfosarcina sp.]|nr:PAS domain S-box protein [Desulfobacterales bacterium]
MPANLTIRTKLIMVLLALGLIPSLLLGYIALSVTHTALSEQAFSHLISTRDAKKAQIERYFQDIRADISVLANASHIVAALDGFSSAMEDGRIDEAQYNYFESLEYGDAFKKFSQEYGYHDLMLITKAGDIVYSLNGESDLTRNVLSGELKDTPLGQHFRDGLESIIITDFKPYPPSDNEPIAFALSPIELLGQIEGVVVLKLSDEVLNTIMTERSGLSESNEAYLVGPDNLMRSDSYLNPKTHTVKASFSNPIEGRTDTIASREALAGKNGHGIIDDYRGILVLSAYGPVDFGNTTYALIVEIDEEEAFGPIYDLKRYMGTFAALLILIIVLASFYIANKSTKPIRELTQSSIEIAAGNLDTEINVESNDELGLLAQSFSTMRDSIRQAHDVLEQRVEERTAELKKLSTAVEQSPASVVITDLRGAIEYVNPKFCEITGYANEEAIGKNPRILNSGHTAPKVYQELWKTITAGDEWRGEFQNKKKNGELYWEAVSISAIKSAEGSISHYLAIKEDITERKQMEDSIREKESRFRGYFEHSQAGMAITSPAKGWIAANDQLQKMLGYTLDELRQMDWAELTHPDDLDADVKQFERMLAAEIDNYTLDKRFIRKDGEIVYTNLAVACIRAETGDVLNVLASFQDITERKNMENDLHERIKELDQAQSAMLNMMEDLDEEKARAQDATRAKSDFLANMSHEIRTPMNAVIGMAHLALKTELTPKQEDYLTKIQSSANSLLGIINDILDFTKIEAGKLDIENVDFNIEDVLESLGNLVTVKAREKTGLEVLFATGADVPRFLVGDPLRLGQVLLNLAGNAVKFTETGEIVVATTIKSQSSDRLTLQFTVSDTGIGLTEEQIGKLGQSVAQADTSTTRQYGGTGLGLTISKRLVEMMGGEIWVESQAEQGSQFHFTVVFGLGAEKARRHFVPEPDLRGMKVLVVDDNATSRTIFKEMLESFTFDVHLAASGKEALSDLEGAADDPFDLVVMDWKMPGMDGIETSSRIKSHRGLTKVPTIIMVTAYGREEVMRLSEKVGLEGFLLKPVNASLLFDAVMAAMGGKAAAGQSRLKPEDDDMGLARIAGARILLVEDNEINQQVAKEILEGAGLVVTIANDGREAVDLVQSSEFEAVLMDVQMPVMDGHTATREIRQWESETGERQPIPIIAMTAHAMAGDAEKSLQAGMNDHVTKPIDPDQLFGALLKWIKPIERPVKTDADGNGDRLPLAADDLPERLPGFDLTAGLKRLQGNRKLYRKLILDFGAQCAGAGAAIKKALNDGDLGEAHQLVHSLKGSAGNLAAVPVQNAAAELETIIKGADTAPPQTELSPHLDQLASALGEVSEGILQLGRPAVEVVAKPTDNMLAGIPTKSRAALAQGIRDAAEIGDLGEIRKIAAQIDDQFNANHRLSPYIVKLADDFDLDGLAKLADVIGGTG